jgi:hypothetical protein
MVKRKDKLEAYKIRMDTFIWFSTVLKALNHSCLTLSDKHQHIVLASLLQKATTKAKIRK